MNPLKIQEKINRDLAKQLRFMYPIDHVCPNSSIAEELKRLFPVGAEESEEKFSFVNSSYVESIPQYQQGESLAELVEQGVLHDSTAKMVAKYFGCNALNDDQALNEALNKVKLYQHQAESIKAVHSNKNLVVCTGTGSGKTESFLIPVLDAIVRERIEQGENYVPGVRAMILYPMNALVNDQVQRIRNIIKAAAGIPGAEDITYGMYTGDVATVQNETSLQELPQECVNRINDIQCIEVAHPWFSEDSVPSNEYIRRSRWVDQGGADILITNYSMLERLMLNPSTNPIFSDTWKFIILDEAHTYDGSMGTEISWLLKRLSKRVGNPQRPLQYLATSATLFADKDDVESEVRNQFAAKIFPAAADTFSVQMGNAVQPAYNHQNENGDYGRLINEIGVDLSEIVQNLADFIKPKQIEGGWKLFDQYKWVKEASRCIDFYAYLDINNINETMSLGDFVCLTTLLSSVWPDQRISIQCNAFVGIFASCKIMYVRKAVENSYNVYGIEKDGYQSTIQNLLIQNNAPNITLPLSHVKVLASTITSLLEKYDVSLTNDLMVSAWPVNLNEDTINMLQTRVGDFQEYREAITCARAKILDKFKTVTALAESSVESVITSYCKNHGEYGRLIQALQEKGYEEYSTLVEAVVGDRGAEEFDAFCQLMAVTKSTDGSGKPLVDLRVHQSVRGLFQIQVQFSVTKDGVSTVLLPNTKSMVNDAGERVYPFACCNNCAHPFIFVYTKNRNLITRRNSVVALSNYEIGDYKYLQALAWERGIHNGIAEDPENEENRLWLEYKTGMLHCVSAGNYPADYNNRPSDFIRIYYVGARVENGNNKHISKCPACGDKMTRGGDYTLLSPYRLSEDQARVFILRTLAQCSEDDMFPDGKPAGGKKVISFADSRAMAARIPKNYDEINHRKLLDYIVYSAVKDKAKEGVTACSMLKNGDGCIIESMRNALEKSFALELLDESYISGDGNETDFEQDDVIIQLLTTSLRDNSHRGLIKRGYLKISSAGHQNRANIQTWQELVNLCQGLYEDSEILAEKLFEEVYSYLFLKGNIRYTGHFGEHAEHYALDARNRESSESVYKQGVKICETSKDDSLFRFKCDQNTASSFVTKRINRIVLELDPNSEPNEVKRRVDMESKDIADALRNYFVELNVLLCPNRNQNSYYFNVEDVRFSLGPNLAEELLFDEHLFCRIEEHSGQIANALAAKHQILFSKGYINILSCSTTFEMGVDLGSLNTVFLCSMPPTVANYRQRAGRAGRRAGSTAYVLTFMGESSHDSNYHSAPEKLFFGQVSSPIIYTDIPSYRAKHLRAEALRHFLDSYNEPWTTCGTFFGSGDNNQGFLAYMDDWYERYHDEVQRKCQEICGNDMLEYSVAADLCFQLRGNHSEDIGTQNYLMLAGPCLEQANNQGGWDDYWKSPLQYRYHQKRASISHENFHPTHQRNQQIRERVLRRMDREDTAGYLASSRVLPRYGFPCDVVELVISGREKEVSLSRDKVIGIREYAVGCTVLANKKWYISKKVCARGYQHNMHVQAYALNLYRCNCGEVFSCYNNDNPIICPNCRQEVNNRIQLTQPDYFIGRAHAKAEYNPQKVDVFYGGGVEQSCDIDNTNLRVSTSATREILYVNTTENDEENAPWLCSVLRTDIVLWSYCGDAVGKLASSEAWWSALHAVLKAISDELNVNSKDVSGIISRNPDGGIVMVIYDSSTSGAGSVLSLMPGNRAQDIEKRILLRALKICQSNQCSCMQMSVEQAEKETVSDSEYAQHAYDMRKQNQTETKRPRKACYNCIMSYANRHVHAKLDAYDASVILKALLGDSTTDDGNPGSGGVNNSPGDGKQETDSQNSQKGGATASATETVGCNCGTSSAPTGTTGGTIPPASSVTTHVYVPVNDEEIAAMREGDKSGSMYMVKVGDSWQELKLERGKNESARFEDATGRYVEYPYSSVYMQQR